MVVLSHADPIVRGNQIHGGHENGVWVVEHGQGQLLSNELYNNSESEISISNGAAPTVRDNLIHHENHLGIDTADAAGGSVKGNQFFGNSGMHINRKELSRRQPHAAVGAAAVGAAAAGGEADAEAAPVPAPAPAPAPTPVPAFGPDEGHTPAAGEGGADGAAAGGAGRSLSMRNNNFFTHRIRSSAPGSAGGRRVRRRIVGSQLTTRDR